MMFTLVGIILIIFGFCLDDALIGSIVVSGCMCFIAEGLFAVSNSIDKLNTNK